MVVFLIKLLVAVVLAMTLLPWAFYAFIDEWRGRPSFWPNHPWAVMIGGGSAVLWAIWRQPNWFIHTLVHEACHAILCVVLFVKVKSFAASDGQGGVVVHTKVDPLRTVLIAIAPYTLPLILGVALLVRMFVFSLPGLGQIIMDGVCAALFVHHVDALYHNVKINITGKQSDLVRVGRPLSLVLIATALSWTAAWTVIVLW